jgi:hypothetical protein
MDRHFAEGATFDDIRSSHVEDQKLESEFGLKFLTYWFDEERQTTFCLVDAPSPGRLTEAPSKAHGGVPNLIIPVDQQSVFSFMGRLADISVDQSPDGREVDRGFRAIMFTDIVDYTATTEALGDARAMELVRAHNDVVRNALRQYGGNEVKHTGDGMMASFGDSNQALRGAADIQDRCRSNNLSIRIGISAGEPIQEDGDFFGSTVNLAARLCDAAGPGEVYLSTEFVDSIDNTVVEIEPVG